MLAGGLKKTVVSWIDSWISHVCHCLLVCPTSLWHLLAAHLAAFGSPKVHCISNTVIPFPHIDSTRLYPIALPDNWIQSTRRTVAWRKWMENLWNPKVNSCNSYWQLITDTMWNTLPSLVKNVTNINNAKQFSGRIKLTNETLNAIYLEKLWMAAGWNQKDPKQR